MSKLVTATFLSSGNGQYFQGHAEKDNEILVTTYYDPHTTLRQLLDGLLEDLNSHCEIPESFKDIEDGAFETALVEMLSPAGRKELDDPNAGPCDFAQELDIERIECEACNGSGETEGDDDESPDDCPECEEGMVEDEDADYDVQVFVVLSVEDE